MTADRRGGAARLLPGGIRARLFFLIALVLLPMILLLAWVYFERYQTRIEQALKTEMEVAQGVASTFSAYLEDVRRSSYTAGEGILTFERYTTAKATHVLSVVAAQYRTMRNLSWVSPDGVVLASSQTDFVGVDLSDRPYFREVVTGRPWAIGELMQRGKVADEPTFAIATALRGEGGALRGVVVAGIAPERLRVLTLTQERLAGGVYAIFDRNGTLVFHSITKPLSWEERNRWRETDPLLDNALRSGEAQAGRVQLAIPGGEWLSARVPIPEVGWVVGAGRPVEAALAPVRERLIYDAVLAAVIASASFLFAWGLARNIAQPILRLATDATALGEGRMVSREDSGAPDEVRHLRAAVKEMAEFLHRREDDLRQSEERYRQLFSTMTEGFALGEPIFDAGGKPVDVRYLAINEAFLRQTGLTSDIIGRPVSTMLPYLEKHWTDTYLKVALDGEPIRLEQYNRDTDRWYDVYCYRPAEGRFAILVRNVTAERQAREALKQSEAEFRQLAETVPQLVWITRPDGYHEYFNQLWYDYTGTTLEDSRGEMWANLLHPDDYQRTLERWRHSLRTGEPYSIEYRFRRAADGVYRWFLGRATPLRNENGDTVKWFGTCTDIHDFKEAEEALRRSEERFRVAQELSPDGFVIFRPIRDGEGRIVDFTWVYENAAQARMSGTDPQAVVGQSLLEVFPDHGGTPFHQAYAQVAESGESQVLEAYYPGESTIAGKWFRVAIVPIGADIAVLVQDVTESKQAEENLRNLKEELEVRVQLRTAELTAANREMEAFAYSVSHDLRAPLRHIAGFVDLLKADLGPGLDEKREKYMRIISEATARMATLIDDLLDFSRLSRAPLNKATVDVGKMVDDVRRELAAEAEGRRIDWRAGELPLVQADPVLLRAVLTNLLANALKYTRDRDPAIIEIGGRRDAAEMLLFVRDNGAGFDMRHADKLFGVFQRLHPAEQFEGTGIGLASVRRIVKRHGGRVWAEGEVDKGATFYVALPA